MIKSKIFGGVAALALVAGLFAVAPAEASHPEWDLSGTHTINFDYNGSDNFHEVTLTQDSDGNLSGSGTSSGGTYAYTIYDGDVSGSMFHYVAAYTASPDALGTTFHVEGTIADDGSLSGTWSDDYQDGDRSGTFTAPAGTATEIDDSETEDTYTVSGGGNITGNTSPKGKKSFTFDVDASGNETDANGTLTWRDHNAKKTCVYDVEAITVSGTTATLTVSSDDEDCDQTSFTLQDIANPGKGKDMVDSHTISGGNITIITVPGTHEEEADTTTFAASNSSYYDGADDSAPLYSTGPISFTWDSTTGEVTDGYYIQQQPANTGTLYFNDVTGGTVSGENVTLTFSRTNPNSYSSTFTGTLVGDILTGYLDGPYYFEANGTTM